MILADLTIDGKPRKVLLHAPKNGFFYVLDRATGVLISAKPYTHITWATGVDMKTGRPVETAPRVYPGPIRCVIPGPLGAHSWQPMSFSPLTGLVYIPIQDAGSYTILTRIFSLRNWRLNYRDRLRCRGNAAGPGD